MDIPEYKRLRQRSTFIRKAHRTRRRTILVELRIFLGTRYCSPIDPIPCRLPKMPTWEEMQEYW